MKASSNGQTLLEFVVLINVYFIITGLTVLTLTKTLIPQLLKIDLYDLARSMEYGVTAQCLASMHWPRLLINPKFICYSDGSISGEIKFESIAPKFFLISETINLR